MNDDDRRRALLHLVETGALPPDVLGEPAPHTAIELPDPPDTISVFRVRVDIDDAKPPIWRRLDLLGDVTLDVLHGLLQDALGWTDSHLHMFQPGPKKLLYRGPKFLTDFDLEEGEEGIHEGDVRLDQVVHAKGDRLFYVYDFGDDWDHTITVESVRPATEDDVPAMCVGGRNACPPENVGGIHTNNDLAAALRGKPHQVDDLDEILAWLPPGFDPDRFDVDETNMMLATRQLGPRAVEELLEDGPPIPPKIGALLDNIDPRAVPDFAALVSLAGLDEAASPDPDLVAQATRPWRLLLDEARENGIPLTAAGYLKPALVEQLYAELGMGEHWIGKGNREDQTLPVAILRQSTQRMGLLRKSKGRLLLTRRGRAAADSDQALWDTVTANLPMHENEAEQDAGTLFLIHVAAGLPAGSETHSEIARVLNELGWGMSSGQPIDEYAAIRLTAEMASLLETAGGLTGRRYRDGQATEMGRALARAALTAPPPD